VDELWLLLIVAHMIREAMLSKDLDFSGNSKKTTHKHSAIKHKKHVLKAKGTENMAVIFGL